VANGWNTRAEAPALRPIWRAQQDENTGRFCSGARCGPGLPGGLYVADSVHRPASMPIPHDRLTQRQRPVFAQARLYSSVPRSSQWPSIFTALAGEP